jgi:hypothetical protein
MQDLAQHANRVSRFLMKRGMLGVSMNCNEPVQGFTGKFFQNFRPMYCRGEGMRPGDIAYSEFAMFGL